MKRALEQMQGCFFAHRGLHSAAEGIPENSLPAFERAAQAGYGVELDVRLSADHELMVFHDDTLVRLCGCAGRIEEMKAAELQRLSLAGSEHTIPTLAECLRVLKGAALIVEIKAAPRLKEVTLAAAEALADYPGPWCLESFHPKVLRILRKHAPQVVRGQLALSRTRPGHWGGDTLQRYLIHLPYSQPDFVAYEFSGKESALALWTVKHLWRLPLAGWTIRSPEQSDAARQKGCALQIFEGWLPHI